MEPSVSYRELLIAYARVFTSDGGDKVMADLRAVCGFDRKMHVIGDPYSTAFNDGVRSVYLHIIHKLAEAQSIDNPRPTTADEGA